MAISVVCACGKNFKVKDESAGKRVKCPACQTVITVPAAGADEDEAPPSKSGKKAAAFEDLGGDGAEVGSRKGGKKKGSKTWLFVGLGAGVLLLTCCCGGLVGGYFLFFTGKSLTVPFEEKGKLTAASPTMEFTKPSMPPGPPVKVRLHYKAYQVQLKAGKTYTIDMISPSKTPPPDPYLVLEDIKSGKKVAEDDDGGDDFNARIVFTPPSDGEYRIICTSIGGLGDFTLSVKEGGKDGGKDKGKDKK